MRSTTDPPRVERLHNGQPIIRKVEAHPWESKVTFNPACTLVKDRDELTSIVSRLPFGESIKRTLLSQPALCFLFYRAQGKKTSLHDYSRSSIGLAVLSPVLQPLARHTEPVIRPDKAFEDLGVEDPRVSKIGDRYFMFYTAYSSSERKNNMRIALASSTDLFHWEKHGLLKGAFNSVDNKNAMLFEDRLSGKFVISHRPMEGENAMAIHWAESDNVLGTWKTRGVLMKPIPNPSFVDTWIGGGSPPLKLPDGRYLLLYHIGNRKADGTREYNLGIAVADISQGEFIVKRDEPLLRPETPAETIGDVDLGVNNVVFVCGAYFYEGNLIFPYAGADSVVLGGKISRSELERYLTS